MKLFQAVSPKSLSVVSDPQEKSLTFIKYKGTLAQIGLLMLDVQMGTKTVQQVSEAVRKMFLYAVAKQDIFAWDLGERPKECLQFLSKMGWMSFKDLLRPTKQINQKYFQQHVQKPDETNLFGNKGPGAFPINAGFIQIFSFKGQKEQGQAIPAIIGGDQWRLLQIQ